MKRALAALLCGLAGCSLITSYQEFDAKPSAVCGRTVPPVPAKGGGTKKLHLTGATSDYTLGETFDGGSPLGFNIDGVCTCTKGGPSSCVLPVVSSKACDDPGGLGIDNGATGLLHYVFGQVDVQTEFTRLMHQGKQGFLIDVEEYNGSPDDPNVTVGVFNIGGLLGRAEALYDGTDVFLADANSVANGAGSGASVYFTTEAYVSGGVLVATLAELPINFLVNAIGETALGTRVQLPFRNAVLAGPITARGDTGLEMIHGQITGRVPEADMLKQLQRIGACASKHTDGTKKLLCDALDITTAAHQGPSKAPCDALSLVLGFSALPAQRQAQPGPKLDPSPGPCPDEPALACAP